MPESIQAVPLDKQILIEMLRYVLIEIRASEDLTISKNLADIFHILPSQLLKNWDEDVGKNAYETILGRARRCGMERYVIELRRTAEASLNR